MALTRNQILEVLYPSRGVRGRRFTQDSPILPDVWIAFAENPGTPQSLLLTPHTDSNVQTLVQAIKKRLARQRGVPNPEDVLMAYTQSHVLLNVTLPELLRVLLPLSNWWKKQMAGNHQLAAAFRALAKRDDVQKLLWDPAYQDPTARFSEDLLQFARIAGAVAMSEERSEIPSEDDCVRKLAEIFAGFDADDLAFDPPPLWSVSTNRTAYTTLYRSRLAVKADAAVRLFDIKCKQLRWAVIDSGVDARHPAFAMCNNGNGTPKTNGAKGGFISRIAKTYDFTRLKDIFDSPEIAGNPGKHTSLFDDLDKTKRDEIRSDLRYRLQKGLEVDWRLIEPLLQIPHDSRYAPPATEHGTHVAGILAADWRNPEAAQPPAKGKKAAQPKTVAALRNGDLIGICPDLELYDLRVFNADGTSDEFTILAALQFVRYLNAHKDQFVIPGVNLSFSLNHDVKNFACGRTPVCEECERLVGSGVVVVAAAGNQGFADGSASLQPDQYRDISITDPGNTDSVITVGSTHRSMPHTYGVSYFSSRGPTGDGRMKPDLVAPGEKIRSTIPEADAVTLDGTSMAAPHVSGAAALLMARHPELIGQPARIKQILCSTATDLGRERKFQGAGMLDILRALQSV